MSNEEKSTYPIITNGSAIFESGKLIVFIPEDQKTVDFFGVNGKVTVKSSLVLFVYDELYLKPKEDSS